MESRVGTRRELYSPLEKLAKPSVRCVWAGPQKRPFHKLGWEIKAPDRAVTGQSLGVERWLSVSNKAEHLLFQKSPPLPFLREA